MTRHRLPGRTGFALAVAAVAASLLTGCTTTVRGVAQASDCARHDVNDCQDYTPTVGVDKSQLHRVPPMTAANMLCGLVDDATLRQIMGGPYYRYILVGTACVIAADPPREPGSPEPPQFRLRLSQWPEAMAGYSIVDGNVRTDVAGNPAWVNDDTLYGGEREIEYTISTSGADNTGGVLFVRVTAARPRGQFESPVAMDQLLPQFGRHKQIAETFINALKS